MEQEYFSVIAYKLYSKENPTHGTIKPLFTVENNRLIEATLDNFCTSGKVFVAQSYDEIDRKFGQDELFRISVSRSSVLSDKVDPTNACKYVATGKNVERLPARLLMQVVNCELPNCNNRILSLYNFIPSTKYIFIRTAKNGTYGPFEWSINPNENLLEISIITSPIPGPTLELGQIYSLTNEQVSKNLVHSFGIDFLYELSSVIQGAAFYDYASDLDIIHYCGKIATTFKTNALEKKTLKNLDLQAKSMPKKLFKTRWERFSTLSYDLINSQEDVVRQMGEFLNSDVGGLIIQSHIEKNVDRYLKNEIERKKDEIVAKTNKYNEDYRLANDRLKELQASIRLANVELENAREEKLKLPQITAAQNETRHAELDGLLQKKQIDLAKLEDAIKQRQHFDSQLANLELIEKKTKEADQKYKDAIRKEVEMKRIIEDLNHEYSRSDDAIVQKIVNMSPIVKTINGYSGMPSKELPVVQIDVNAEFKSSNIYESQQQVCAAIESAMALKGRIVSQLDILNLLICTQQSFITYLSGLPGAGKTSISRLLANVQNLGPRLNEISVGRGWTSQKDLIGFYNPLISKFQPSNTGMYEFLQALRNDPIDESAHAMAYVLLDEANLSPIEHYWSAFFGMTDTDGTRTITLGTDDLAIPRSLRFLATINHDGTTEPLSARAIDRAPFIVMESGDLQIEDSAAIKEVANIFPLSFSDMDKLFGNSTSVPLFNESEEPVFKKIKQVLTNPSSEKGRPITISVRKEYALRQYCNKARALMNFEGDLVSLDYAILQFVLPLIRGSGTKFAKRLEELKLVFVEQNLQLSSRYLERMINFGASELHSYDFFCW